MSKRLSLPRPSGGHIDFYGDPAAERLVLIVGRDDFFSDEEIVGKLIESLTNHGLVVARYVSRHEETRRMTTPPWARRLPRLWRAPVIGAMLVLHPSRWDYLLPGRWARFASIDGRAHALRSAIRELENENIVLLARSAGARVATLIVDETGARGVAAMGYPFENPAEGPNPDRFRHLAALRTPLLIIQGNRDEYGGAEIVGRYPLSPSTQFTVVDSDHSMEMTETDWSSMCAVLASFCLNLSGSHLAPTGYLPETPHM